MRKREMAAWAIVGVLTITGCKTLGALWATPSSPTYIPPATNPSTGLELPVGSDGAGGTVVVAPGTAPVAGQSMGGDIAMGAGGVLGLLTGNPAIGAVGAALINILGAGAAQRSSTKT